VVRREAPPHPSLLSLSSGLHIISSIISTLPNWSNPQMEGKMPFHPHLWKDADAVGKALQTPLVPFETR